MVSRMDSAPKQDQTGNLEHYTTKKVSKGQELNAAPSLASQPAASHNFSFIITIFCGLGLWPVYGAGRRKLRPNLAVMPW